MKDLATHPGEEAETRRDFLYLTAGAMAAVGTAAAVWPLIDSMNPAADVRALVSVEVDLEPLEVGQRITVKWRGEPIFISRRTAAEIERARVDDAAELPDPEPDSARAQRAEWLIVIGVCTHLGCIPKGQGPASPRGEWDGWFCPCHGSHYDTSGRIRKGPAPRNLVVPVYAFLDDLTLGIG
jgi:ubiquinol-cytochrome c reductase iron-sulfur subunit